MLMTCIIFICVSQEHSVKATGIEDIHAFDELEGDAQYVGSQYRDNYHLDMEDTGFLDIIPDIINGLANALFSGIKSIAYIAVALFYYALDFDLASMLGDQINSIQKALNTSLFKPMFPLLFAFSGILVFKRLIRRDLIGTLQEFGKVIFLVVMSMMVVSQSATILSGATNITKGIGIAAINGINNKNATSTSSYAAEIAGNLWVGLIHEPWKSFNFASTVDDETVHKFLSTAPGTSKREDLVDDYMDDHPNSDCFDMDSCGWRRIPVLFIYFFVMLVKCGIYMIVATLMLAFQAIAVLFVLLAPVVLILAMMPGYEMNIISTWLRKLFETQLSILLVTFLLGLLIKFDEILYSLTPVFGWYIVMFLQVMILVGVIIGRKQILHAFTNMQRAIGTPGYMNTRLRRGGNLGEKIDGLSKMYGNFRKKAALIKTPTTDKVKLEQPEKDNERRRRTTGKGNAESQSGETGDEGSRRTGGERSGGTGSEGSRRTGGERSRRTGNERSGETGGERTAETSSERSRNSGDPRKEEAAGGQAYNTESEGNRRTGARPVTSSGAKRETSSEKVVMIPLTKQKSTTNRKKTKETEKSFEQIGKTEDKQEINHPKKAEITKVTSAAKEKNQNQQNYGSIHDKEQPQISTDSVSEVSEISKDKDNASNHKNRAERPQSISNTASFNDNKDEDNKNEVSNKKVDSNVNKVEAVNSKAVSGIKRTSPIKVSHQGKGEPGGTERSSDESEVKGSYQDRELQTVERPQTTVNNQVSEKMQPVTKQPEIKTQKKTSNHENIKQPQREVKTERGVKSLEKNASHQESVEHPTMEKEIEKSRKPLENKKNISQKPVQTHGTKEKSNKVRQHSKVYEAKSDLGERMVKD